MVSQDSTFSQTVVLLSMLIQQFVFTCEVEGRTEKTTKWYGDLLGQFLLYLQERGYPADLPNFTLAKVRGYVQYLRGRNRFATHPCISPREGDFLSVETVRCHLRTLKVFAGWLFREGHTDENRLQHLRLPKAPQKVIEPLSEDEIRMIVEFLGGDSYTKIRNHSMFCTLIDAGLRASELAGITLNNINLKEGQIKVMGRDGKKESSR